MTSNKSFMDWGEVFNDQVLATAIFDWLLHHATTGTRPARHAYRADPAGPLAG